MCWVFSSTANSLSFLPLTGSRAVILRVFCSLRDRSTVSHVERTDHEARPGRLPGASAGPRTPGRVVCQAPQRVPGPQTGSSAKHLSGSPYPAPQRVPGPQAGSSAQPLSGSQEPAARFHCSSVSVQSGGSLSVSPVRRLTLRQSSQAAHSPSDQSACSASCRVIDNPVDSFDEHRLPIASIRWTATRELDTAHRGQLPRSIMQCWCCRVQSRRCCSKSETAGRDFFFSLVRLYSDPTAPGFSL